MAAKKNACTNGKEATVAQMIPLRTAMQHEEVAGANVGTAGNSDIFVCVAHSPPVLQVLPTLKAYTSLRIPAFVCVEKEKRC